MKKKVLVFLAMVGLFLGRTGIANANLITNGSFESGSFTPNANNAMSLPVGSTNISGWFVENGDLAWINTPNHWGIIGSDGNFFLDLTGYHDSSPYGKVSQLITSTVVGQQYTLLFDLGTDQSNPLHSGPVFVLASAGSASQLFFFNPTGIGSQWQTFILDFVSSSTDMTISFIGVSGLGYIGLDNVSVIEKNSPVPEPATMLLFGTGVATLAGSRVKRKKK